MRNDNLDCFTKDLLSSGGAEQSSEFQAVSSLHILWLDLEAAHETLLSSLERQVASWEPGGQIYFAQTLAAGKAALAQHPVDVILLLPTATETLSKTVQLLQAPVVAVLEEHHDALKAGFTAGIQDYLTLDNLQNPALSLQTLRHVVLRHRFNPISLPQPDDSQESNEPAISARQSALEQLQQSGSALHPSEEKYGRLAANVPGVIFRYIQCPEDAGSMLYISTRCRDTFGIDAEAVMEDISILWESIHPEDKSALRTSVKASQTNLNDFIAEFRVIHPGGTLRWVQCAAVPELFGEGVVLWEGFVFDCTEQKQAEQLQRQYMADLKLWRKRYEDAGLVSGQILFEWDVLTDQPTWGPNTQEILGRSAAEMPYSLDEWLNLIHPEDQATFMKGMKTEISPQSPVRLEYRIQRKDGSYVWVEDRTQMLLDAEAFPDRLLGFIGEITQRKEAELALQESETRFRLLSELAPIGIFQADPSGKTLYQNSWLQALSDQADSSRSRSWLDLVLSEDRLQVSSSFQQFVLEESNWSAEFRLGNPAQTWVLGQATPLHREDGTITGFMGTVTDITAQKNAGEVLQQLNETLEQRVVQNTKALQEAKNQLQAVLDAVPGCILWINSQLEYLGVNQLMAETFGMQRSDFVGQKIGLFGNRFGSITRFMEAFVATQQDSAVKEIELQVNQQPRYYLAVAQRYNQGQAVVFVVLDITERKQGELEIQRALEKTQELSELKSRFISIASHEFRTPLTTIFSASELLEHYGSRWNLEKQVSYLKQIQNSVKHMTRLLDDVLLISAGEAGKLKFEPVLLNIVDFCQSLVEEFRLGQDCRHTLNFTFEGDLQSAELDEKLLRHVLSNLLSNAAKYSPEHQPIEFNLRVDSKTVTFTITDHGIGIPPEDQLHLFELFHRAGNVGTIAGTGLGLAIVKKAVTLHSGLIDVKSAVGSGTQFTVSIPTHQSKGDYQW